MLDEGVWADVIFGDEHLRAFTTARKAYKCLCSRPSVPTQEGECGARSASGTSRCLGLCKACGMSSLLVILHFSENEFLGGAGVYGRGICMFIKRKGLRGEQFVSL